MDQASRNVNGLLLASRKRCRNQQSHRRVHSEPATYEEELSLDESSEWLKLIDDESPLALRKTHSEGVINFDEVFDDKPRRGKYKCGRCGQVKVNHNCPFGLTTRTVHQQTDDPRRGCVINERTQFLTVREVWQEEDVEMDLDLMEAMSSPPTVTKKELVTPATPVASTYSFDDRMQQAAHHILAAQRIQYPVPLYDVSLLPFVPAPLPFIVPPSIPHNTGFNLNELMTHLTTMTPQQLQEINSMSQLVLERGAAPPPPPPFPPPPGPVVAPPKPNSNSHHVIASSK